MMRAIGWRRTRAGLVLPIYPVAGGGDWPAVGDAQAVRDSGLSVQTSPGQTLTAPASPNTKPTTWTQLIADIGPQAGLLVLHIADNDSGRFYIDIGIGPSTNEVVLVPDILAQANTGNATASKFEVPIVIPANARISARAQCDEASKTIRIKASVFAMGGLPSLPLSRVTAYGLGASTTGTVIDPGGSVNTKGSYAELVASTMNPCRTLLIAMGHRKSSPGTARWALDLAIGSGPEQIIIPDWVFYTTSPAMAPAFDYYGAVPIAIRAGTRIAARCQSSTNDAGSRAVELVTYGID